MKKQIAIGLLAVVLLFPGITRAQAIDPSAPVTQADLQVQIQQIQQLLTLLTQIKQLQEQIQTLQNQMVVQQQATQEDLATIKANTTKPANAYTLPGPNAGKPLLQGIQVKSTQSVSTVPTLSLSVPSRPNCSTTVEGDAQQLSCNFPIVASGTGDLFVSKDFDWSVEGGNGVVVKDYPSVTNNPIYKDSDSAFNIPAGSKRDISLTLIIKSKDNIGNCGYFTLKVNGLKWGTSADSLTNNYPISLKSNEAYICTR